MAAAPDITSKASLQRILTELEVLKGTGVVSDAEYAVMQETLNAARVKVGLVKFILTCAFSFVKKADHHLSIDAGQKFEVIENEDSDWYLGRVVGGKQVVGWVPKNKFV
ncbi:hypothetical protein FN846DRAFT_904018 [Sphaerosporella brunnea]|uniref:SH3 domain-containing protein n=1 Tax=Sphaerosporella brunnea TaxID=1250544 RepID=A0A5J5F623_9PEZI|nr:hypothetical protein FN846DRAFT_904018 [Sphaerosporella brunnea]